MKNKRKRDRVLITFISFELAFNSFLVATGLYYENKGSKTIKNLESELASLKDELFNLIIEDLVKNDEYDVSTLAEKAINKISMEPIRMKYLDNYEINKESAAKAYLDKEEIKEHTNTSLYDVENDDINWDLALEYIYQNSLENASEEVVPLSKEEIKQHLEFIEEAYDGIKAKFKDYDTAELACNLENYSFFESEKDNGNFYAATYLNNITYYPLFDVISEEEQEKTVKHEAFHLLVNGCTDKDIKDINGGINVLNIEDSDNPTTLLSYNYSFLEEIYASLFSKEITDNIQTSYLNYNEALNLVQGVFALNEDYKLDQIFDNIVSKDANGFIKSIPTYGENKEQFLIDTIEALKGLDLLMNPNLDYYKLLKEQNSDITYYQFFREIRDYVYTQFSKIYYNNLILLNEKHPELTLEDNKAFITLYNIMINNLGVVLDDVSLDNEYATNFTPYNIEVDLPKVEGLPSTFTKPDIQDFEETFSKYLSKKYNLDKELPRKTLFDVKDGYQFPEILGEEKRAFYQAIYDGEEYNIYKEKKLLK